MRSCRIFCMPLPRRGQVCRGEAHAATSPPVCDGSMLRVQHAMRPTEHVDVGGNGTGRCGLLLNRFPIQKRHAYECQRQPHDECPALIVAAVAVRRLTWARALAWARIQAQGYKQQRQARGAVCVPRWRPSSAQPLPPLTLAPGARATPSKGVRWGLRPGARVQASATTVPHDCARALRTVWWYH